MPFIHQMVPLYFAQLIYAVYVLVLKIKWSCFLPKIVKIRAELLKLLAEMRGPLAHPVAYMGDCLSLFNNNNNNKQICIAP